MAKFNLDKGSERKFDLSKGSKRKFDLSKDDDEPVETPQPQAATAAPSATAYEAAEKANGSKKWPLIIGAVAIAAALAWWLMTPSSNTENETTTATPVEEVTTSETDVTTEETPAVETPAEAPVAEETPAPAASEETAAAPAVETPSATAPVSGDIEAEARKVIRGDYGIGQERKTKLGGQYSAIQARVNQLKREGAF